MVKYRLRWLNLKRLAWSRLTVARYTCRRLSGLQWHLLMGNNRWAAASSGRCTTALGTSRWRWNCSINSTKLEEPTFAFCIFIHSVHRAVQVNERNPMSVVLEPCLIENQDHVRSNVVAPDRTPVPVACLVKHLSRVGDREKRLVCPY